MTTESIAPLPAVEIERRLMTELPCWRFEEGCLRRTYRTGDWHATLALVNAIGRLADAAWHHPELLVSFGAVEVRLHTHDADGVTGQDFALARDIDAEVHRRLEGGQDAPVAGMADEGRIAHSTYS